MKTLREELKKYDFTDYEDDDAIIVESYHINDVLKAVRKWLTKKREENKNSFVLTTKNLVYRELLGELET